MDVWYGLVGPGLGLGLGLEGRGLDCYNGAQRYERFLQVSQLYRALILLGLALSSSAAVCLRSS